MARILPVMSSRVVNCSTTTLAADLSVTGIRRATHTKQFSSAELEAVVPGVGLLAFDWRLDSSDGTRTADICIFSNCCWGCEHLLSLLFVLFLFELLVALFINEPNSESESSLSDNCSSSGCFTINLELKQRDLDALEDDVLDVDACELSDQPKPLPIADMGSRFELNRGWSPTWIML